MILVPTFMRGKAVVITQLSNDFFLEEMTCGGLQEPTE